MISKFVGLALMVVGALMAWVFLWPLLLSLILVFWQVVKLGIMLFVAYIGYCLWRQRHWSRA